MCPIMALAFGGVIFYSTRASVGEAFAANCTFQTLTILWAKWSSSSVILTFSADFMQRRNPNYIPPAWKESCVSAHIASWRGRRKKIEAFENSLKLLFFVIKAVFVGCMNFACAGLREVWCAGVCGKLGRWMCFHTTCFAKHKKSAHHNRFNQYHPCEYRL